MTTMVTVMMRSARSAAAAAANCKSPLVSRGVAVRSRSTIAGSSAFNGSTTTTMSSTTMSSTHDDSNRIIGSRNNTNGNTLASSSSSSSSNRYGLQQVACCSSHAKDNNTIDNNHIDNVTASSEVESTDSTSTSTSNSNSTSDSDSSKPYEIPGAQKGGRKLAIVFTCTVCDTRSAKQFTEQAYTNGVVLVRCPGCENLHLIADRLGYFQEEDWDLESLVQQKGGGEKVRTVTDDDVWELTLEDLVGTEKMNRVLESVQEDGKDADENKTTDKDDGPPPKA